MIEVFAGRIGGSKTYHAVIRIADHLADGGHVCTNVELRVPELIAYIWKTAGVEVLEEQIQKLPGEQIREFHLHTPSGTPDSHVLVVVDEAHIWCNARDWGNASRDFLNFLTQSRKCFTDVVFISQHENNLDKQIMRLVQYVWRFRDMKLFRILGFGAWPLNQFLCSQYDIDGKTLINRKFESKRPAIYGLYDSFALLSDIKRAGRSGKRVLKKRPPLVPKPMKIIFAIILFVLAVCAGAYWSKRGGKDDPLSRVATHTKLPVAGSHLPGIPTDKPKDRLFLTEKRVLDESFGVLPRSRSARFVTDRWPYEVGKPSPYGTVRFIIGSTITCDRATVTAVPQSVTASSARVAEVKKEIVVAENKKL